MSYETKLYYLSSLIGFDFNQTLISSVVKISIELVFGKKNKWISWRQDLMAPTVIVKKSFCVIAYNFYSISNFTPKISCPMSNVHCLCGDKTILWMQQA